MHHSYTDALFDVLLTLIAALTIFISWGQDAPICNLGLVVGGLLLGHVLTEVLNQGEGEEA